MHEASAFPPPDASGAPRVSRLSTARRALAAGGVVALLIAGVVWWSSRGADDTAASADGTVDITELWTSRVGALRLLEPTDRVDLAGVGGGVAVFSAVPSDGPILLVALDAATGGERWVEEIAPESGPVRVVVFDEVVVAATTSADDGGFARTARIDAIDLDTGERRWFQDGLASEFQWTVADDLVLAVTEQDDRKLVGRDLVTGDVRWERTGEDAFLPSVVRANGLVFVAPSIDGDDTDVSGVDLDGNVRWTRRMDAWSGAADLHPSVDAEVVALYDGDRIVGLDLVTGDDRWSAPVEQPADATSRLLVGDGDVVVACTTVDESTALTVVGVADGGVRWAGTLDVGDGFFGLTAGVALTGTGPRGGCSSVPIGPVRRLEALSVDDGSEVWATEDDVNGILVQRSGGIDTEPALVLFESDVERSIDLATGASTDWTDAQSNGAAVSLDRYGGVVLAMRAENDDEWSLVDASGVSSAAVTVNAPAWVVGRARGVVYVRSGVTIVAVD